MMRLKPWPVVAGILVDSLGSIAVESIVETLSFFAVIPAAALGGYGAARMNRRTESPLT